jgi:primosomal replication protein N
VLQTAAEVWPLPVGVVAEAWQRRKGPAKIRIRRWALLKKGTTEEAGKPY